MQVPVETMVIVMPLVPLVVHTPVVWLANVTARPEDDVADIATVLVGLNVWLAGVPNVMV